MSEAEFIYVCGVCGKKEKFTGGKTIPLCCTKQMLKEPLDQCTIADHPEMVRNTDKSDPCDDGRGK